MRHVFIFFTSLLLANYAELFGMEVPSGPGSNASIALYKHCLNDLNEIVPIDFYNKINSTYTLNNKPDSTNKETCSPFNLSILFLSSASVDAIASFASIFCIKGDHLPKSVIVQENKDKTYLRMMLFSLDALFDSDFYLQCNHSNGSELHIANNTGLELDLTNYQKADDKKQFWKDFFGKKIAEIPPTSLPDTSLNEPPTNKKHPCFWPTLAAISFIAAGACGFIAWRNKETIKNFNYSTLFSRFLNNFKRETALS